MAILQTPASVAIFFLLAVATGLGLGNLGIPFNSPLGLLHKLLGLGWVVFASIAVIHAIKAHAVPAWAHAVVGILGFSAVALFLSGALLALPAPPAFPSLAVHRIASGTALLALAVVLRFVLVAR